MDEDKMIGGLNDAIELLKRKGYHNEFIVANDCLKLVAFDRDYQPEDVHIHGFYRFEDDVPNSDMPIIYALQADDNVSGYLVDMRDGTSAQIQAVLKRLKASKDNSWHKIIKTA